MYIYAIQSYENAAADGGHGQADPDGMCVNSARGLGDALNLGQPDQIAFAVADIDAVLPCYEALFGTFTVLRATFAEGDDITYRGEPARASLKVALARSGDLEIELIEVVEGEAPTSEHVRLHGDGLHHVRFPVADLDRQLTAMHVLGWTTVLLGSRPSGLKFAYLESEGTFGHTVVELIEFPPDDPRSSRHSSTPPEVR
jgi:hypothetical protein